MSCPACLPPRDHTPEELREFHPNTNPDCAACRAFRLHTPDETSIYHPLSGHGCVDGKWTHPALDPAGGRLIEGRGPV